MIKLPHCIVWLVLVVAMPFRTQAEVSLPSILDSGMVLQCGMPVPIWGWADSGEQVNITFAGQTKTAVADDNGRWTVELDKLEASAIGQPLTIKGSNVIELADVLVGEVWICSGQSNMEWNLGSALNGSEEVAASENPLIRLFNVSGHTVSPTPKDDCPGQWQECNPQTSSGFSAVGYFFGRRLANELSVPIGLIGSNWGGTRIEPWTTREGFQSVPQLADLAEQVKSNAEMNAEVNGGTPGAICNAMIQPLAPYALRGAIWYQGEANGGEGDSYLLKTEALVNGWRQLFNRDLAFYWVQLADFQQPTDDPQGGDGWARLRESQRKALAIKHTGMAVTIEIGQADDIHPRNKQDVGWRLAQWALHQTYGKKEIVPSGPLFKSIQVEGSTLRIRFANVGSGLMVGQKTGLEPTKEIADGSLARFAVAGEDQKWSWAKATIDGDTVVVGSTEVTKPVAVRYAYSMNPAGANLYNKEGLPASPFRSDNW